MSQLIEIGLDDGGEVSLIEVGLGLPGITAIANGSTPVNGFSPLFLLRASADGTKIDQVDPATIAGGGGGGVSSTLTNVDIANLPAGTVVCAQSGGFVRASSPLRPAMGLITTAINVGTGGLVQVGGTLTLNDWTLILGAVNLVPRQLYYLDPLNPGKLTTTVPIATGQICQVVGQGLTGSTLAILVQYPIVL